MTPEPTARRRTLELRAAKGALRNPVTGRAASTLKPIRTPNVPSPDWRFQ